MYQLGKTKNNKFFEKSIIPRGILFRLLNVNILKWNVIEIEKHLEITNTL